MARQFVGGSSQYLATSSTPITAVPFTLSCLFRYSTDVSGGLIGIGNSGGTEQYLIYANTGGTDVLGCWRVGVGGSDGTVVGGLTKDTWYHAALVVTAIDDIDLYNNGTGVNDTDSIGIANWDRITIGCEPDSSRGTYLTGMVAEPAAWNATLTQAEIDMLVARVSPLQVRPGNLVFYPPLVRDNDEDIVGGLSLTASGSPTIAAHPPVFYSIPPQYFMGTGEVPPIDERLPDRIKIIRSNQIPIHQLQL